MLWEQDFAKAPILQASGPESTVASIRRSFGPEPRLTNAPLEYALESGCFVLSRGGMGNRPPFRCQKASVFGPTPSFLQKYRHEVSLVTIRPFGIPYEIPSSSSRRFSPMSDWGLACSKWTGFQCISTGIPRRWIGLETYLPWSICSNGKERGL